MSFTRFLKNLFTFTEPRRRVKPKEPQTKEEFKKEIEFQIEKGKTRPGGF